MQEPAFSSIIEAFQASVAQTPEKSALFWVKTTNDHEVITYSDWNRGARNIAAGFAHLGIESGDRLLIALPTHRDFLDLYLACLLTGVIPLIIGLPGSQPYPDVFIRKARALAEKLRIKAIILPAPEENTEADNRKLAEPWQLLSVAALRSFGQLQGELPLPDPEGIAHLQATSGSTGMPRLALIRHRNLVANVLGIGRAVNARPDERIVSWLPMSHDMGLVSMAYTLFWQGPLVVADPSLFVRNPINWLRMITQFKGDHSPAPNSAFQTCARLMKIRKFKGLDLTSWRIALCGSEPVYQKTIQEFTAAFAPYGFNPTTFFPVYGLAESTLATTLPALNQEPLVEEIDLEVLETEQQAVLAHADTTRKRAMVAVGKPLQEHTVRIVDELGETLVERKVGEVEIKGPSVIDGYWEGEGDTGLFSADGFLRTGDLGYLANGNLYITGRKKEIMIINGRNFIANQLEEHLRREVEYPFLGAFAVCGKYAASLSSERLVVLAEQKRNPDEVLRRECEERIRQCMLEGFAIAGTAVVWLPKGGIPRTTSGKVRRDLLAGLG